jgi:uncharacterized membrane protein YdjX (TVP38/TMEM64 family)
MKHALTAGQIIRGATLVLALLGAYVVVESLNLEEILRPDQLVTVLQSLGPWAPVALIVGMTTAVVVSPIPSLPLDLAAGAAFGPTWGTTYAVIGAEIGAILSFLIGRALGRDVISRLLRTDVAFCQTCSDHQLMGLIFVARLIPVFSFDVISYGAGLTGMSLTTFAVATLLGMIPATFAFTYFGSSVVSAQWVLILAGLLMVAFFLIMPKLLKRYRSSWVAGLMLGPPPAPALQRVSAARGSVAAGTAIRCVGCGRAMG